MSVNTVANGELVQVAGNAFGVVDDELNAESTNPVQNKAVAEAIGDILDGTTPVEKANDADNFGGKSPGNFYQSTWNPFVEGETILAWANSVPGNASRGIVAPIYPSDAPEQTEGSVEVIAVSEGRRIVRFYGFVNTQPSYQRSIFGGNWDDDWMHYLSDTDKNSFLGDTDFRYAYYEENVNPDNINHEFHGCFYYTIPNEENQLIMLDVSVTPYAEIVRQVAYAYKTNRIYYREWNTTFQSWTDWTPLTTGMVCNPNLLDNWYFLNPVNQMNFTTGTTAGKYTIDRWYARVSSPNSGLTQNGFLMTDTLSISQPFDDYVFFALVNKTVTFSILDSEGNLATRTIVVSSTSTMENWYAELPSGVRCLLYRWGGSMNARLQFLIGAPATGETTIVAAKLELGSFQTLAHKEGNIWVLNEIPKYSEQLLECQRYYYENTYIEPVLIENPSVGFFSTTSVYFPVTMRTTPTIQFLYNEQTGIAYSSPSGYAAVIQPNAFTYQNANNKKVNPIFSIPEGVTVSGNDSIKFLCIADANFY